MKPSPVVLSLAAFGLFSATGQVVYINPSPSLVVTSGSAGPNMFGSRYLVDNNDWDIALSSNSNPGTFLAPGTPTGNVVTENLGTRSNLSGTAGTFTLIHRAGTAAAGGGFSWTVEFAGSAPPSDQTILWGDRTTFTGTPPVPVSTAVGASSSILNWSSSSSGSVTGVEANQAGRSINVLKLAAQATSTGGSAALSNVAFQWNDTGSLTTVGNYNNVNVVSPASSVTQTLYFTPPSGGSLLNYNWTLTGDVTLTRTAIPTDSVMINFTGFQQSFTVVPEPEDYVAVLGGVSLLGAWFFRRRRTQEA